MDSLRERSFSGLDSFFEPEQPKTGGRRILLLVALLVALGGAGWWTYTNYLGVAESRKPEPAASSASEAPAEKPSTKPAAKDAAPALDAGSSQAVVPSGEVPQSQAENASAAPDATRTTVDAAAKPAPKAKPVTPAKIAPAGKRAAKREPRATPAKASKLLAPAAADTGDAAFRRGEAYLYGRGVPKNCDEAVKYLKAASAKSSAKARSAFGTMYATGHCVQRDLPTSYLWFALALRVDPNNQILEKDLSAVWNQMTPPERQMATRMKQ
jgi:cytoskeletal protein RodZ